MVSDYRIVCPSKQRVEYAKNLYELLPQTTFVVPQDEYEEYAKEIDKDNLVILPNDVPAGYNQVRQWILDNFEERTIIFIMDDVTGVRSIVGQRERQYKNSEDIIQIFESAIQTSRDMGITLFYWTREPNPMYFSANDPYGLSGGYSSVVFGQNGRKLKVDTNRRFKADVDITLQALYYDRFVFCDKRFYFETSVPAFTGKGGSQAVRTYDEEQKDIQYLKNKWGKWLKITQKKSMTGVSIKVPRKNTNMVVE